ncbi:valine--tRNA ligase [Acetobacteraceae bacterium]|nr:valine--tRNA ligase [Candidatus Parcubacteria bacterium]
MPEKFTKPYDHKATEGAIYQKWEESGYFNPDNLPGERKEPFSIVLPPPNVTGTLHMGHAAMLAVEDILIRFERMRGKKTLWIPGTDSAAIATQSKVEDILYKTEKKTRHDVGREDLLKRIDAFTDESKSTIVNQLRRMGSSLDWSRYTYTMDEKRYKAVMEAFVRMYNAGLIYRGNRIVNWDPKLQTTVSDDEIEYKEQTDSFYHFQYGPFVIGTVRPETKFGDKYVVMHPNDARYKEYAHGQQIDLEWINGPITATIIKDEAVDMEFGSGVMTITPAHSLVDFEIAKRHGLDIETVIDERGILLPIAGEFAGQHIKKARPAIVEKLQKKGLIVKTDEKYVHNIATNSRGGGIIEPQIKRQWFVAVNKEFERDGRFVTLKQMMREALENKKISITPDHFEKIYYHWINNLRDWCISRQIWFGHRIPVWYKTELGSDMEAIHFKEDTLTEKLGLTDEKAFDRFSTDLLEKSGWKDKNILWGSIRNGTIQLYIGYINVLKQKGLLDDNWINQNRINKSQREAEMHVGEKPPADIGWYQDPDTLDTWFSSGLWTFSTLGWPEETQDLRTFHPTSVLETGYDILFFWVARMILMSGFLLNDVPFKRVYLHGLVRDAQGRKMSKSLGNIIDPLDMIEKYGADAVRLSLIVGAAPGNDIKLSEDRVRGYKHFANKIWNITRFILDASEAAPVGKILPEDQSVIDETKQAVQEATTHIEKFRLDLAVDTLYQFVWSRFADVILEESKPLLRGDDAQRASSRSAALTQALTIILAALHPFMPFVTEEIWSSLPGKKDLLMVEAWPAK